MPKPINVTKDSQSARFTAGASDAGSGVCEVALHLDHSIRSGGFTTNFITFNNDVDFSESGQSSVLQEIDSSTGAGVYTVDSISVLDKAGHNTSYHADQLGTREIDMHFMVKSRRVMDITPPTITSLSLPKTVNATKGDKPVSFMVGAVDTVAGVKGVLFSLDHAIQSHGQSQSTFYFDAGTDDFVDGRSVLSQQIDSTTGAGTNGSTMPGSSITPTTYGPMRQRSLPA